MFEQKEAGESKSTVKEVKKMKNPKIKSLQDFYLSSTSELCEMALATQGKSIKTINFSDLSKLGWRQNVLKGILTKKLNQLLSRMAEETKSPKRAIA